jgi:ribosome-interacting GTPase 1
MLMWKGARIQIFDMPGLIEGSHIGKGGGIRLGSVMRIADLVLFVVDATDYNVLFNIMEELSALGIKVNKGKPKIKVEEVDSGGIEIISNGNRTPQPEETVSILNEFGIYNAKVIFWENSTAEDLFDFLTRNNVYVQGFVVANKMDLIEKPAELAKEIRAKTGMPVVQTSALEQRNIEELKDAIFQNLELERVYLKPKDGQADYENPVIMKKGSSVSELAKALHSDTVSQLRYALVNGSSARFKNQVCGPSHVLEDGDVVTLVYSKV